MSITKLFRMPAVLTIMLFLFFAVLAARSQIAQGIAYLLPDNTYFSDGANVHLVIAEQGDASQILLDAPETWVKIFFDPALNGTNVGIQMAHADFICNPGSPDPSYPAYYYNIDSQGLSGTCDNSYGAVKYEFYCSDSTGKNPNFGSMFFNTKSDNPAFVPQGFNKALPGSGSTNTHGCPVVGAGAQGRYIVYVRAYWNDAQNPEPPEGRINGFKVAAYAAANSALSSYWAQGTGYAVQNRVEPQDTEGEFNFEFAPQCDEAASQTAFLKWSDADAAGNGGFPKDGGTFGGDNEIYFELFEGNIGGGGLTKIAQVDSSGTTGSGGGVASSGNNIGGNNENRQLQFTARNDKVYKWTWHYVNRFNGVQMTMPFDSYYYQKSCPPPIKNDHIPQGVIDAWDCNKVPGWAYDQDSPNTELGIHIYVDSPASPGRQVPTANAFDYGATNIVSPDINGSGLPNAPTSGNHRFEWFIPPAYKDGATHRFYIYVRGVDSTGSGGGIDGDANNPEITAYSNGASFGSFACAVKPTMTIVCDPATGVNSGTVTWVTGTGGTNFTVDIGPSPPGNFSGTVWTKGVSGTNNTPAPAGFPGLTFTNGSSFVARIKYNDGGLSGQTSPTSNVVTAPTCLPPPIITCTDLFPADTEPGAAPFNLSVKFSNAAGRADLTSTRVDIKIDGVTTASPQPTGWAPPLAGGSTATIVWNGYTPPASPGMYDVILTFSGGNSGLLALNPVTCPIPSKQLTVANRPYFRAYGGDVISGTTTTCSGWPYVGGAGIDAYNDGGGRGAGVQIAALALGQINGFLSTTGQTAPAGPKGVGVFTPPKLTFANNVGTYGGNAGFAPCPPDYFNSTSRPAAATAALWGNVFSSILGLDDGDYYFDAVNAPLPFIAGAPVVINSTTFTGTCILGICLKGPLGTGRNITFYVNGDVIIDGDIAFADTTGGWGIGTIPSFYVIAQGNIYVKPSVHQLDGVYVAQVNPATGTGGKFYSCANDASSATAAFINANCNSKLNVNGVVMAQKFRLFRVLGTRLQSSPNEFSSGASSFMAEMFNAGPETWLTIPAPFTTSPIDDYDAITSLPPVL